MSVLVTGGAGYIGSHMVLGLVDRGERVVVIDDLSTGFDWCVSAAAKLIVGDVGDRALVARALNDHGVTSVIHFAASLLVEESVRDPIMYYTNNTFKTHALLAEVVRAGIPHFLLSSTAAVYGMAGEVAVSENAPLNPLSPYGRSKLMCEMILSDVAAAHGLGYAILRYFNVAGADPECRSGESTRNSTHLIKIAIETALNKRSGMKVYGTDYPTRDGTAIRDYIHVTDLIDAHLECLDRLRAGGENLIANVGYGHGYSVREVLDLVQMISGVTLNAVPSARRPGDPASIVADSSFLRSTTSWSPRRDELKNIIEDAFQWERHLIRKSHV